ncbi:hypothetical protein NSP_3580 [Nodularia spumigena CCY9414]|nr:hypothetical protein NSP_3580 [Nodularia spumigena CCY9414]
MSNGRSRSVFAGLSPAFGDGAERPLKAIAYYHIIPGNPPHTLGSITPS